MMDFNSYMYGIDTDFFKDLCLKEGELRHYKRNEFILREGEVWPYWGMLVSGIVKYTCANQTESKVYNVGFSFAGEFIADYPACLYGIRSELNIQTLTPCGVYLCPSEVLNVKFEEGKDSQRVARVVAEQLFLQSYSRYLDMFRLTPEKRYIQLLKRCPEILQMVALKEIASYLKITPTHMSRIRKTVVI